MGDRKKLASDTSVAIAWALTNLQKPDDFWNGIRDHFRPWFEELFDILEGIGIVCPILGIGHDATFALDRSGMSLGRDFRFSSIVEDSVSFPDGLALPLPDEEEWWLRLEAPAPGGGKGSGKTQAL